MAETETQEIPEGLLVDESGGNFEGVAQVTEAEFLNDPQYQGGVPLLLELTLLPLDGDAEGTVTNRYSLGGGWETPDGGETADHPQGKNHFHVRSQYGSVIGTITGQISGQPFGEDATLTSTGEAAEIDYGEFLDHVADKFAKLERPVSAKDAALFVGEAFEWAEIKWDFGTRKEVDEKTGEEKEVPIVGMRSVPVRWIPEESEGVEAKKKPAGRRSSKSSKAKSAGNAAKKDTSKGASDAIAKAKAAKAAKEEAADDGDAEANGQFDISAWLAEAGHERDDDTVKVIAELLGAADGYGEWENAVAGNETLLADEELLILLVDESDEGFFAAAEAAGVAD